MEETLIADKKKELVPKLRFKEFDGEWNSDSLSGFDLTVIDGDRGTNYPNGDDFSPEGYCLFMNAKNVTKAGFSFEDKMFITKEKDALLRKGKLKRNDLILTTRGSVGNIAFYNSKIEFEHLRINSGMVLIRNENKNIDPNFIYSCFFSPKLDRQLKTIVFGSAQPQLTVKEINKFKFSIPTLSEQQKIASFLSSVDEKIQQLTRKKELLEQYKKGVMQQLFYGKLRFKDENGKDYPKWEEKEIGEIFDNYGGTSLEEFTNERGKYKFISIGNYSKEGIFIDTGQRIELNAKSKNKVLNKDELVMVLNDKTKSGDIIGSTILIDKNDTYIYNQRSERLTCKSSIHPRFAWIYLNYAKFRRDVFSISQGGTQIYVNFPMVKKIKLLLPSLNEQEKLIEIVLNINNKIVIVNNQITQTQTFKKGLLQQMFV